MENRPGRGGGTSIGVAVFVGRAVGVHHRANRSAPSETVACVSNLDGASNSGPTFVSMTVDIRCCNRSFRSDVQIRRISLFSPRRPPAAPGESTCTDRIVRVRVERHRGNLDFAAILRRRIPEHPHSRIEHMRSVLPSMRHRRSHIHRS